jgi:hypothetical protein
MGKRHLPSFILASYRTWSWWVLHPESVIFNTGPLWCVLRVHSPFAAQQCPPRSARYCEIFPKSFLTRSSTCNGWVCKGWFSDANDLGSWRAIPWLWPVLRLRTYPWPLHRQVRSQSWMKSMLEADFRCLCSDFGHQFTLHNRDFELWLWAYQSHSFAVREDHFYPNVQWIDTAYITYFTITPISWNRPEPCIVIAVWTLKPLLLFPIPGRILTATKSGAGLRDEEERDEPTPTVILLANSVDEGWDARRWFLHI